MRKTFSKSKENLAEHLVKLKTQNFFLSNNFVTSSNPLFVFFSPVTQYLLNARQYLTQGAKNKAKNIPPFP